MTRARRPTCPQHLSTPELVDFRARWIANLKRLERAGLARVDWTHAGPLPRVNWLHGDRSPAEYERAVAAALHDASEDA